MRWLLISLCLITPGVANMNDEEPVDEKDETEAVSQASGVRTLGGRQLWGDLRFFRGWRIQENVLTGRHRLLDGRDHRHATGTREVCEAELQRIRVQQKLPPMSGKAVVLIHGMGRSSKCYSGMAAVLAKDGYVVVGFDYPSTRLTIQESSAYLHSVLQSLDGIETIDVVSHSMGGLLLRACLQIHKEPRIRRAVMLGVPNKGAQVADFFRDNPLFRAALGPAGQQLVTDRDGLIGRLPTPEFEFGIVAGGRSAITGYNPLLPGDNDSTVTVASTRLSGAADFILLPVIHSFLMADKAAIAATQNFLKHGRFDPDGKAAPISEGDISVIE